MAMTNMAKLVAALATPASALEVCLQQMLLQRSWDTAVGAQLDQLGAIVGQARGGLDDDVYRRYIVARISTNASQGRFEDLITIAVLVLGDSMPWVIDIHNEGTATCRIRVAAEPLDDDTGAILSTFMQLAKVAGVRLVTEWSTVPVADAFTFDGGPGFDNGHLASDL